MKSRSGRTGAKAGEVGASSNALEVVSRCPWRPDLSVAVVDDGRVAYAYVRSYQQVSGEVWLYNHGAPDPAGTSTATPPARNPLPFASARVEVPVASADDVTFEWVIVSTGPEVRITLRGRPLARVRPFERPGRCANAAQNGPVARVLGNDREPDARAGGGDPDEG